MSRGELSWIDSDALAEPGANLILVFRFSHLCGCEFCSSLLPPQVVRDPRQDENSDLGAALEFSRDLPEELGLALLPRLILISTSLTNKDPIYHFTEDRDFDLDLGLASLMFIFFPSSHSPYITLPSAKRIVPSP